MGLSKGLQAPLPVPGQGHPHHTLVVVVVDSAHEPGWQARATEPGLAGPIHQLDCAVMAEEEMSAISLMLGGEPWPRTASSGWCWGPGMPTSRARSSLQCRNRGP